MLGRGGPSSFHDLTCQRRTHPCSQVLTSHGKTIRVQPPHLSPLLSQVTLTQLSWDFKCVLKKSSAVDCGRLIGVDMYYSQDICMIAIDDAPAPTEAEKNGLIIK